MSSATWVTSVMVSSSSRAVVEISATVALIWVVVAACSVTAASCCLEVAAIWVAEEPTRKPDSCTRDTRPSRLLIMVSMARAR